MTPPPLQATGHLFPVDWNSKTRTAWQSRKAAGHGSDHIFLILQVKRPPWSHMRRKAPWRLEGEWCQGMFYPYAFPVKSILAKNACTHMGGPRDIPNVHCEAANQNDWPKEAWKKCPEELIEITMRVWLWLWHSQSWRGVMLSDSACVSIHMNCTLFPSWYLLHYILSCENSFMQSRRARTLSLTTGLLARIQLLLPQPDLNLWPGNQATLQATAGWN